MVSLKPNKTNVIGTVLLVVANFISGYVSRVIIQLFNSESSATASTGGRGAFAGNTARFGSGNFGFLTGILNIVIVALLFYIVLSFILEKFPRQKEDEKQKESKKK